MKNVQPCQELTKWTDDEISVFVYWAMNYPKAEIQKLTRKNIHNIDLIIRLIYERLNVNSRAEMIIHVWLNGMVNKETFVGILPYRKKKK